MVDILLFLLNVTVLCFSLFTLIKVRRSSKRIAAYLKQERECLEQRKALLDELCARFESYLKMEVCDD